MLRVQAQLTSEQAERLKALADAQGVSVASLLRRGADLVLAQGPDPTGQTARDHALAAAGRFVDAPDVARRHDEHLDDAYGA